MENDANVRYRVVTGVTSTRGDPPFLKLVHAFLALSKSLDVGLSGTEVLQYSEFCSELLSAESLRKRHAAIKEACRREVDCYAAKQERIERAIAATEADIAQAEATLLEAQVLRANLEEYERRREGLMQHASRAACTAERQRVLSDASVVESDCAHAHRTVQAQRNEFATLLHVLEMLQKPITEGPSPGVAT